ncbi:NAD(P)-dependent alcohol dehydrogenase [Algoriphagus vanfongensis]|uniref:NAD(P)-dependent alcohol dehydrogenase n=1 Tax=Algoriphagus vanfongensis TaxID=426371 RepID=UPI00047901E3|nr:NAD(P)-dependent alcohol dehydrogenase [Algoriphagus vanfongensis]
MKAAFRDQYGSADQITIREMPIPQPSSKEIQIQVIATTINRTDMAVITGLPWIMRLFVGFPNPKSPIPGTDFVGIISEVGLEVKEFQKGEKVWGFIDNGCGSHAEYFCTSSFSNLQKMPDGIPWDQAAGSIEGVHYAYNFINKLELNAGDEVLVIGGTGAIGSAAIQILKSMDIHVTAVCLGHKDRVQALGTDHVIDGLEEDFTACGKEFDAVFDAVGKSRFKTCKPLLKEYGVYISSELGPHGENPLLAIKSVFIGKKKVNFPFPVDVRGSLEKIAPLIQEGKFTPLIDRQVKLEEAIESYAYVQSGQKIGNVILRISEK